MSQLYPRNKIFFTLTQIIAILFWGIPELYQKPFKILILLFIAYCAIYFAIKDKQLIKNILLPFIGIIFLIIAVLNSNFQTNVINISLSFFCIPFTFNIATSFTNTQKNKAKKIGYILCFLMFLQLLIFRSQDGRPNLGYEINWSAAYLFIFFIYSDHIQFKFGKLFVIGCSFLLLSRLLILSIILFYLINWGIRTFKIHLKLNWYVFQFLVFFSFFLFNGYFILNVEKGEAYDSSINRLKSVNDGSNMLRFTVNTEVLSSIPYDEHLKFGYGRIHGADIPSLGKEYGYNYFIMPHNELLDGVVEFGYIFMIYCWIFSGFFFSKVFKWYNYGLMVPILIYTLILWARFLIIPSLEMFFILSLLVIKDKKLNNTSTKVYIK